MEFSTYVSEGPFLISSQNWCNEQMQNHTYVTINPHYLPPMVPLNIVAAQDENVDRSCDGSDNWVIDSTINASRKHRLNSVIKRPIPAAVLLRDHRPCSTGLHSWLLSEGKDSAALSAHHASHCSSFQGL